MLEFINVSKSFWTGTQRKVILDRASFEVPLGQSLGILAPNGTGKTTLSADPALTLICDDEHGLSDNGSCNFEG